MTKLVCTLVALFVFTTASLAGVDDGLRQEIQKVASPKLYVAWKRAVEAEEAALGKPVPLARQQEIFATTANNFLKGLPEVKAAPPPPAQAVVAPAKTARYLADRPLGQATKPHLGSSYPGYWMLMAHNDGEEPKWIFVEDGVKRLFNRNHVDMTDEPYDGPDFKKVTVTVPKDPVGALPVAADPVAAGVGGFPFQMAGGPGAGWNNGGLGANPNSGAGAGSGFNGVGSGVFSLPALAGTLSTTPGSSQSTAVNVNNSLNNKLSNSSTNTNKNGNANGNSNGNGNGNKNKLNGKNQQRHQPCVVKLPTNHRQHQ